MVQNKQYELITKYRMAIFGIAQIWILLRHTFYFNNYHFGIFDGLIQTGDCGVDIFMFLSGFGLFFSYEKCNSLLEFYRKRVLRIVPSFVILIVFFRVVYILINGGSYLSLLNPMWWLNMVYNKYWFIGAILLLYFSYPIIYKFVKRNIYLSLSFAMLIAIGGLFLLRLIHVDRLNQLALYFARVPIFVTGAVFAYKQDLFTNNKLMCLSLLLSIPLIMYLPKDFQRISYGLATIGIITYLPLILNYLPQYVIKYFNVVGKSSLEVYLIHIFLFSYGMLSYIDRYIPYWACTILVLIIISILSYFANILLNKIIKIKK